MAELHALRIAAVFTANSDFELWIRGAALLDPPLDKHSDAFHVQRLERIVLENSGLLFIDVVWQKPSCVIAGKTHRRLRQVVRAEREELGNFGNLIREERRPRQLDHGADEILNLRAFLFENFACYS